MIQLILLSLIGFGAAAALLIELFSDNGSDTSPQPPGGEGDETITGTEGNDLINGGGGDDLLLGLGGDDVLNGGIGNDKAIGAAGNDLLTGDIGNDTLDGGDGSDTLLGGAGDDEVLGRAGNDLMLGGTGDDMLAGAQGDDLLIGGLGVDSLSGGIGDDVLVGVNLGESDANSLDDIDALVTGLPKVDDDAGDILDGGFGTDILLVGSGDVATGGGGSDQFIIGDWIAPDRAATITDYAPGTDVITLRYDPALEDVDVTVTSNAGGDALVSMNGQLVATVRGAGASLTVEDIVVLARDETPEPPAPPTGKVLSGTTGDDTISGTNGDDIMNGLAGDDVLWGRGGSDLMFGREGDDVMTGAAGTDRLFGNEGNDLLSGLWGNDLLRGGQGDDLIIDTIGTDTLYGDNGNDTIVSSGFVNEAAFMGTLVDTLGTSASLEEAVDALFEAAPLNYAKDTDSRGDEVYGGRGDDVLIFGLEDTVTGGSDDDTFVGGDWIVNGKAAVITDFEIGSDTLVYSVAAGTTPALSVTYAAGATADAGDASVLDGANVVMVVRGVGTGFTLSNVTVQTRA